jgi:DNA repair exonuclease SbcCD ATPase subunit
LKAALDNILAKTTSNYEITSRIEDQNKEINSKIKYYKTECSKMKKELEGNINIPKITDLENESKFLSKKLEELKKEKENLSKFDNLSKHALKGAQSANSYPEKIQFLKSEIRNNKEKIKELIQQNTKEEKSLKAQHEKCVDLEKKSRKLFEMIKARKKDEEEKNKKNEKKETEVNEFLLNDIQEQILKAEKEKIEKEANMKNRIKSIETSIREKQHFLEMLKVKLKEKDQECRLSLMRISESKKLVKHNQLKPLSHRSRNSTPKRLEMSPMHSPDNHIGRKSSQDGERRRSSTNQKLFHQETMKIIKNLQTNLKFVP